MNTDYRNIDLEEYDKDFKQLLHTYTLYIYERVVITDESMIKIIESFCSKYGKPYLEVETRLYHELPTPDKINDKQ
ncbi:hypothetical protein [Bacillus sp. COPE52]|uniref:hypothetical protein n=1 Tax=Bacillus sp. COPE52 TaxID=2233998 RepID=UPI000E10872D|nr:hypothetical protein [Bacillus sp. COPE52]AXK19138.1 hypothetical protein DPQ31_16135 [Bacillus sp. COPE52]